MTDLVKKLLGTREVTKEDVAARLNREIIPVLIELRQRFNELLSPPAANAYTVTNPVVRRSFDTATVTLPELAQVVGTMIADLKEAKILK